MVSSLPYPSNLVVSSKQISRPLTTGIIPIISCHSDTSLQVDVAGKYEAEERSTETIAKVHTKVLAADRSVMLPKD